ncbi:Methionyl-tRNA formyltransferase [Naganishia albida]|nr:Methionyl-tRNA formyltransferase [Naganishia albida]
MNPLNILFLGSDLFSIGTLQPLLRARDLWGTLRVVTAGEKDVGRGGKSRRRIAPPLHDFALQSGLEVLCIPSQGIKYWQPPDIFAEPSSSNIIITSSFGNILPTRLLSTHFPSPSTRLNVHPSLLPQYRGAAPIQWAIARQDAMTGVSVQSLAMGGGKMVDHGELWAVKEGIPIDKRDTYTTLLPRLADIGGNLLLQTLHAIRAGTATSQPQLPPLNASGTPIPLFRAPKITHKTVHMDWKTMNAQQVEAMFRGMSHQHALWTTTPDGHALRLLDIRLVSTPPSFPASRPGTALFQRSSPSSSNPPERTPRLLISCADGEWIDVRRVQAADKKEMGVGDWWNGLKTGKEGLVLGQTAAES